jgi:hypothetical protein
LKDPKQSQQAPAFRMPTFGVRHSPPPLPGFRRMRRLRLSCRYVPAARQDTGGRLPAFWVICSQILM